MGCLFSLEHDPEKWVPVFPRDKREAFARRSCSNKKIERDDDSKKSHPALGTSFQHRPEIGAGTLGFEPRRVGCIGKAEITVDQANAMVALGRDARRVKGV